MVADIAFWGLGLVAVISGAAVFYVDSMARATYALALSFIAVGLQVLFLQQNYVGVVTILMMVMEMAVMAVYMVMFMGMNPALMPMSMVHSNRTAVATAVLTFGVLAAEPLYLLVDTAVVGHLGARDLAGLGVGVWPSMADLEGTWHLDRRFEPEGSRDAADAAHGRWRDAVER